MLRAILNKTWRQHPTRHQLYGHLPPITKTIQVRRTRHAGHCWGSRDELISDVLLWTPTCGRAKAGRPARTYIQQLCEDMGCSPEELPEAMNDREGWRERVRESVLVARHDDDIKSYNFKLFFLNLCIQYHYFDWFLHRMKSFFLWISSFFFFFFFKFKFVCFHIQRIFEILFFLFLFYSSYLFWNQY